MKSIFYICKIICGTSFKCLLWCLYEVSGFLSIGWISWAFMYTSSPPSISVLQLHALLWIDALSSLRGREALLFYRWKTEKQRINTLSKSKQDSCLRDGLNQRGRFYYTSGNEQPDYKTIPRLLVFFHICCCNFEEGGLSPAFLYYSKLSCFTSFLCFFPLWNNLPILTRQDKTVYRPLMNRTETRTSEYKTRRTTQQSSH